MPLDQADPDDFDALVLPGGVMNPDKLRMNPKAVQLRASVLRCGKAGRGDLPRAVDADRGRRRPRPHVTSWPSLQTDLENAGAKWVDQEVVNDDGLVTSRKPDDLPAFNRKMIEEFAEGAHEGQRPAVGVAG